MLVIPGFKSVIKQFPQLLSMSGKEVRALYALGHAAWYEPFKRVWNWLVASKAEKELSSFLKHNLNKKTSILELGCGTAINLSKIVALKLEFKEYTGVDFSPDMLGIAKKKFANIKNVRFIRKDITKQGIAKGKFDVIICTWVLSHLQHPAEFVNQAQKMLKPTGKMFLIFFSKPEPLVNLWLGPIAKYVFRAKTLEESEINKFRNTKKLHRFSAGITTSILIAKALNSKQPSY